MINNVESISLLRSAFAGFGAAFGGKNTLIQEAVNRLQQRGMIEFTNRVQTTYPNTVMVVGLQTHIGEVGRNDKETYMVITISGTCLAPITHIGGRRQTRKQNRY